MGTNFAHDAICPRSDFVAFVPTPQLFVGLQMLTDPPDNFHMDPSCQSARLPADVIAPAAVRGRLSPAAAAAPLADPPTNLTSHDLFSLFPW